MAVITSELVSNVGGSRYTVPVKFNTSSCKLTVEKLVTFERGGTFSDGQHDSEFAAMIVRITRAVRRFWSGTYELVVTPSGEARCPCKRISIDVRIRQGPGGYRVTLVGGGAGASGAGTNGATLQENNRPGAPAEAISAMYAHEFGHFGLGLPDEYAGNNAGSPVHVDGSLMGNYHSPLEPKPPEAKPRHFEHIRAWVQTQLPPACIVTIRKVP